MLKLDIQGSNYRIRLLINFAETAREEESGGQLVVLGVTVGAICGHNREKRIIQGYLVHCGSHLEADGLLEAM